MFVFCFNECIPQNHSDEIADRCLNNSLREYHKLAQQFPEEINGIVTSHGLTSVQVNHSSSLYDSICRMRERELKRYAYSVFNKYPVDSNYDLGDEAELISNNFVINIGTCRYDAMYPFIVFNNGGVLFSLAVHDDLYQNRLSIFKQGNKIAEVANLYGCDINTDYIASLIRQSIQNQTDNFGLLLSTVGGNKYSDRFRKKFESFPTNVQQAITDHFAKAKTRNLPTPFSADKDLIKDVTPDKETEIRIFELRVFTPVACRVYFYETANCIYLGSVENKPPKKTQDSHIMTARNIIKELVAL